MDHEIEGTNNEYCVEAKYYTVCRASIGDDKC